MKKIGLFLLTLFVTCSVIIISCTKTVKIPVSFSLVTNHQDTVTDIFIPDAGTYTMEIMAKYLSGYTSDNVTLKITGLPADITVTPDSFTGVPTFVENFVFTTTHAAHAKYPISIVATAPGVAPQTYTFNLTVIAADCATSLLGSITGHNTCAATSTTYPATVSSTGINTLIINGFGGYGTAVNAHVILNCDNDSLSIPSQDMGNGVHASGYGTFTPTGMKIWYVATSTPTGGTDNCSIIFTK